MFYTNLILLSLALGSVSSAQDGRTFRFAGASLRSVLDSLRSWYPVSIVYLDRDVEGKEITAACTECGLEEALGHILSGTGLTWIRLEGQIILRRQPGRIPTSGSVSGTVTDSLTGEPLAGASVLLRRTASNEKPVRWCSTNPFGFYSLRNVPAGEYSIEVRSLGYRRRGDSLLVLPRSVIERNLPLAQQQIPLQEVTVEGHRTSLRPAEGLGRGIFVRSAPVDRTEYLLDGGRIYNPVHVGGVLDAFNPEALNDVDLHLGGIPPYYGGRIGGILDLSLRPGRDDRVSGTAGTGSLGSHGSAEGPIGSSTTFLVAGRRGYPDLLVPGLDDRDTPNRLGSSEVIARVGGGYSGGNRIAFTGYFGKDRYGNAVSDGPLSLGNAFEWKNILLNLRWVGVVSPALFLHASVGYTGYALSLEQRAGVAGHQPIPVSHSTYFIDDFTLRAHAEHYADEDHTLRGGVELVRHGIGGSIDRLATRSAPFAINENGAWELSVYLQDQWRLLPSVTAELGARATTFSTTSGAFSAVDPRFALICEPDANVRAYTSLTAVNQFLHPYRSSGVFAYYPMIFWYPSADAVRPMTAIQWTAGLLSVSEDGEWEGLIEGFYRTAQDVHEPDSGGVSPAGLYSLLRSGSERTYGAEIVLRKRLGGLTGSLSYRLSRSELTFPELNGGASFTPRFDRRHEIQGSILYRPDDAWVFGARVVLVPGLDGSGGWESSDYSGGRDPMALANDRGLPFDPNGNNLPGFQRLEFSIGYHATLGGVPGLMTFRLLNGYGLLDPIAWRLAPGVGAPVSWDARLRDLPLFPLYPVIDLTVRW